MAHAGLRVVCWTLALLGLAAAGAPACGSGAAGSRVRIVDIGSLAGHPQSFANDVNERGDAVGASQFLDGMGNVVESRGVLFRNGRVHSLPLPAGASYSWTFGNNIHGVMVGEAGILGDRVEAVWWVIGRVERLPGLPGGGNSFASDLTDRGVIAGGVQDAAGAWHAAVWEANGLLRQLAEPAGSAESYAIVINRRGQAVGTAYNRGPAGEEVEHHAVLWQPDGTPVRLAEVVQNGESQALFINKRGIVVGWATDPDGKQHAAIWVADRVAQIGDLTGLVGSLAGAINDRNEFVTRVTLPNGSFRTEFWGPNRVLELNALLPRGSGWANLDPFVMNNRRQLVGPGELNGRQRAFLLNIFPAGDH